MNVVKYAELEAPVLLGDIVATRVFFIRREARVVYVPGISKKRSSLEYNGLTWVGLQELRGPFLSALVDPKTGVLDKGVKFLRRGEVTDIPESPDPFIEPDEVIEDADEGRKG